MTGVWIIVLAAVFGADAPPARSPAVATPPSPPRAAAIATPAAASMPTPQPTPPTTNHQLPPPACPKPTLAMSHGNEAGTLSGSPSGTTQTTCTGGHVVRH